MSTLLRFVAGTYFVLTSLYCLLAYLPYTFFFLIKSPAYAWMPWFVHHQAGLYWIAAAAAVLANWRLASMGRTQGSRTQRSAWRFLDRKFAIGVGLLTAAGIYLSVRPFLATLEDNRGAYAWSLAALVPLAAIALWKPAGEPHRADPHHADPQPTAPFGYSFALLIAAVVCGIYAVGARVETYHSAHSLEWHWSDAELTLWSLLSHAMLAVAVLSILNLIFLAAARSRTPRSFRRMGVGALVFVSLYVALSGFLANALSFGGWPARAYAAALALSLTLWGCSIVLPILDAVGRTRDSGTLGQVVAWIVLASSAALAVAFPVLIGGDDWSGFFSGIVTLIVWITAAVCLFHLRPARARYSILTVLLVLVGSGIGYKLLGASEIFWSRPLGTTDDEISLALEAYGGHDTSFQLAHHILGDGRSEVCGDLCRILREYTNVRDTEARTDVRLVDSLTPAQGPLPNIFIFVIDSMRPDYLGAYNPRVDYTPNLDAFARDSVVFHHAYSQYAGTSLSEPAIWSGAMMLHAHYVQPFSRLNSLDRLVAADGYRRIVSWDEVLSEILPANDNVVKLDTDKKLWNELEIGSTLQQARAVLDAPHDPAQPVFFYAQPKNVHQFAQNHVPGPASVHWQSPAGLNARISYEVHWVDARLGEFFSYLKQRGLYDSSIIIVTSDHGDATGELGRISHSTVIWPEVMHVPLIVHLPAKMREHVVYDDTRLATLTDITPSLYYLLGHRPIRQNPLYGRPLFAESKEELKSYPGKDLLLASDVRAVYGILTADGRYLYTTYDSPAESYLFDLRADPDARHNVLTPALEQHYDEEIIDDLHMIGNFYRYHPGVESLLASAGK
jgi:Sulfatase